ncbi:MAG: hypothetical protein ABH950_03900 [Candidatus Altiarchaeota archaeon]
MMQVTHIPIFCPLIQLILLLIIGASFVVFFIYTILYLESDRTLEEKIKYKKGVKYLILLMIILVGILFVLTSIVGLGGEFVNAIDGCHEPWYKDVTYGDVFKSLSYRRDDAIYNDLARVGSIGVCFEGATLKECETLQNPYWRSDCIKNVQFISAVTGSDESACKNQTECLITFALVNDRSDVCETLEIPQKDRCFSMFASKYTEPLYCEKISTARIKDECYWTMAIHKRDVRLCNKAGYYEDKCLQDFQHLFGSTTGK